MQLCAVVERLPRVSSVAEVDEAVAGIFLRDNGALVRAVKKQLDTRSSAGVTPLNAALYMLWPAGVKALLTIRPDTSLSLRFLRDAVSDLDGSYVECCLGVEAAVDILELLYRHGVPLRPPGGCCAPSWQVSLAAVMARRKGFQHVANVLRHLERGVITLR